MKFRSLGLLTSLVLFLTAIAVNAQVAGELNGRVFDPSGAVVGNASVELTQAATDLKLSTTTTSSGDYVFRNLQPGEYNVAVTVKDFAGVVQKGITVSVGETTKLDVSLKMGNRQQTVTVDADAPLLEVSTSNIQTNIQGRVVTAMPLNARNFVQLATLAPGVELPPGTLLPRINGGRPRTNEYLFDGISALQPEPGQVAFFPIIDDIQEFTIESNNVPAEFGRFNGGVVNISTRSGSNQLHGSLYEFLRNEDLNARNYFATTGRKPEYRRNLFGGTIGAPILHNRLFFFGDYQGIRQLIGVTRISTIPTNNERQGIFTGVSAIYNPTTRVEFPNDTINIPFDPVAQALLARLPTPTNLTATANNYTRTANDADHQSQFDARVDGAYGNRDRAFGRYTYYNEVEQPVTPFPDGSGAITGSVLDSGNVAGLSNVLGQQAVFNETHTFSAHLLNDVRLGYTRRSNTIAGVSLTSTPSAALGIPGIPTNAAFSNALPLFTFSSTNGVFQQLGSSASTFSQYQTGVWQAVDTVSFTRARHAIQAGMDMRWYQLNAVAPTYPTGLFAFTATGSDSATATGGNAFASFLLGQVNNSEVDLQQSKLRPRDHIFEYFVQDDWKVSDRLTLNLGLRYTLHFPSTEKNNQGAVFNLATQQLQYVGVNGNSKSARELHYGNVAPRVGLAYSVTPRTVVRSGFGMVFIDQSGITTPFTVPQFPFVQSVTQKSADNINAAFTLSGGPTVQPIAKTATAGLGQSVYTATRNAGSGYVEQWNLAVQHALTSHLSVDFAYVGSHIVHVGIPDQNLNQLTDAQLATGLSGTNLTAKVTNPCFGVAPSWSSIGGKTTTLAQTMMPYNCFQNVAIYRNNTGKTNYNAGEAKIEQRFDFGLQLLAGYTHSRLIDDASSVFSTTVLSSPNSSSLVAADTYRPWLERDVSSGDMPNVTTMSAVYALPAGKGHRFASTGLANVALGGWQLNSILLVQSGMPVTVTQATNNNSFAGVVLQRPNLVGNPYNSGTVSGNSTCVAPTQIQTPQNWFNKCAFNTAAIYTFGSASRNPVRGPAYRDLDMALVKNTKLGEGVNMEFRGEIFDILNTPEFGQPSGSFGSAAFGSITTTVTDPRVVQFAIRISR
jgi:hypothetical protein